MYLHYIKYYPILNMTKTSISTQHQHTNFGAMSKQYERFPRFLAIIIIGDDNNF